MLDGETYVAKSTSKVAPLRTVDQLSHRERNKIEKMAFKHGLVYVIDPYDTTCAFVVSRGGEWQKPDDLNSDETARMEADFRSGADLQRLIEGLDP